MSAKQNNVPFSTNSLYMRLKRWSSKQHHRPQGKPKDRWETSREEIKTFEPLSKAQNNKNPFCSACSLFPIENKNHRVGLRLTRARILNKSNLMQLLAFCKIYKKFHDWTKGIVRHHGFKNSMQDIIHCTRNCVMYLHQLYSGSLHYGLSFLH